MDTFEPPQAYFPQALPAEKGNALVDPHQEAIGRALLAVEDAGEDITTLALVVRLDGTVSRVPREAVLRFWQEHDPIFTPCPADMVPIVVESRVRAAR